MLEPLEGRQMLSSVSLDVAVENLSPEGGLFATPFWLGVHDGTFDIGSNGISANAFPGLEQLAEEGDTSGLSGRFQASSDGVDTTLVAPDGFPGAPVFDPGEIAHAVLDVSNPGRNRYFSFASMVIPSNDAFLSNLNPRAYRLFNAHGDFRGPLTIDLYGHDVWDAGTEVNDPAAGAAFSTVGGLGVDEQGKIHPHAGLDEFVGTGIPTSSDLQSAFMAQTPLARITISLASDPSDPIDRQGPKASLQAADILTAGQASHEFQVIYSDPSGVDLSSIDTSDLRVVRSGGRGGSIVLFPTSVTTDAAVGSNPRTVTATYQIDAPGDEFDSEDSGTYRVFLTNRRVEDVLGNRSSAYQLGHFLVSVPAAATQLQIQVENLSPDGGLFLTPFWVGVHDGSFDLGTRSLSAERFPGLEPLAEEGSTAEVSQRFQAETSGVDATIIAVDGFPGAPVFDPGETAYQVLEIDSPSENRYFSFASMVIPSNDAFLANLNAKAHRLFDAHGNFHGPLTIDLYGRDVWDAGTERNDPFGGAAFSLEGGESMDENGAIHPHLGLDDFLGAAIPPGGELQSAFVARTPLARITISLADDPSDPIDRRGPEASLQSENVTTAGQAVHEFQVTYFDPSGVDVSSIDSSDLKAVRVGGFGGTIVLTPTTVTTDEAAGAVPRTVTATYQVPAPGGAFDSRDSGRYEVILTNRRVEDALGNRSSFRRIGSFEVDIAPEPARLEVSIENLASEGGLFLTPFWVGFHDGNFDLASLGRSASKFPGLEALAEEGDTSELSQFFQAAASGIDTTITAPDGFPGAPVFDPGDSASQVLEIDDPRANRYFSFAAMVIPSNDAFLANLNRRQHRLFDTAGNFLGPITILVHGSQVWDAGTESNDPEGGAAFTTAGGTSQTEAGVIRRHGGLDEFVGAELPTGQDLQQAFDAATPLARITIRLAT